MSPRLFAFYALWLTPSVLMAVIASVMRYRRLDRDLPAFFAYAIFTAARTPVLFYVFNANPLAYSYLYWVAEAGSAVLGFAAIYEVFRHLFRTHETVSRLGSVLFRWAAGGFVLLAVVTSALAYQSDASWLEAGILSVAQGVRLVQCGLLLFIFAVSGVSGLAWRSQVFGIALGFGLFAGVQLVTAAIGIHAGQVSDSTWRWVNMASYNCAVLVWTSYLLAPRRAEVAAPLPQLAEVRSWNQALLQFLQR